MVSISKATIERLSIYCLFLKRLLNKKGDNKHISSYDLGKEVGASAAQVRKDLSYFGNFGCKGVGYDIENLEKKLEDIIGFRKEWQMALVGAGNLGTALVNYKNFRDLGLNIEAVFDCDLAKIGNYIGGIMVRSIKDMEQIIREKNIKVGIIAVPADDAQKIAENLVAAGVKAIWNFAPITLKLPDDIILSSEYLLPGLASLVFCINNRK